MTGPLAALAIKPIPENEAQAQILRRAGFYDFDYYVILLDAHTFEGGYNPFEQHSHTRQVAHQWIKENFDTLADGDVVDVEFLTGVRAHPKVSEIQGNYPAREGDQI